ncbi:membrane protein EE49B [Proboscivirus elephantidbeta5]|uniref:Membrane protein EE49B n=1 Tax=Elephant endotheliotropic herpesvirus 5 TaxID=768738 RepID=A0A075CYM3_9BETA|nr:membrane protein EE49B [Elephant endotheliotropic herpesvirus 5]AHC02807.1 membrane protein EE49B [Elephant endotheliotropic herpesvirus 5]
MTRKLFTGWIFLYTYDMFLEAAYETDKTYINEGANVTLRGLYTNFYQQMKWTYNDSTEIVKWNLESSPIQYNETYKDRVCLKKNGDLEMKNVQVNDTGVYMFIGLYRTYNTTQVRNTLLIVSSLNPTSEITPINTVAQTGSKLFLSSSCESIVASIILILSCLFIFNITDVSSIL